MDCHRGVSLFLLFWLSFSFFSYFHSHIPLVILVLLDNPQIDTYTGKEQKKKKKNIYIYIKALEV